MDHGKKVWCPHLQNGFQLGEICDFQTDTISVQPLDGGKVVDAPYDAIYPAEEDGAAYVADNCGLMFLNEATLLHNLDRRFQDDQIYTYTANILLALNPYHSLDIYTTENVKKYQGQSLGVLPPHIYAVADKSYRDMRNLGLSQSIMCSGESGAGKTESTKHLLRYLTDSYGGGGDVADLESRILAANPLLESFGNAKTTRNNNSSRFGKFVELHFNRNSLVIGAHIIHYLLEKSRIIDQTSEERNYQVFYRMCRGSPKTMRDALSLAEDCSQYSFLKNSCLTPVPFLDDVKEFAVMEKSMTDIGLDPKEKSNIFRITAAVLHIGNIEFEEVADGCKPSAESEASASGVAAMLGMDRDALMEAIAYKTMNIGGTDSKKALSMLDTRNNRNAFAKSLYSKLFDWIVERINTCFPFPVDKSVNYIGILDIAGFEYFRHNSFEQFCINYCNEKLQQFFNQRVLKDEQELYVKESIKFKEVEYVDNQDVIDMIEGPKVGILAMLDEESKLPRASDETLTEKIHKQFSKHFRLQVPRKSKMSYYKQLRDNEGFIIRHFAGAVCYQTKDFMDKNNDALTHDLFTLMTNSKDPFIKAIFEPKPGEKIPQKGKLTLISLGTKFKKQLGELMAKLNSTRANFVRCIKPNQKFVPKMFTGGDILSQLQCAGMVTVMDLMQGGFPSRTQFSELYDMYKDVLPPELKALDPRTFAKALFKALGLNEADFQFGVSRVFFRPGKFAEFDTIMKSDPANLVALVEKVVSWLKKQRWKKLTWACVASLKFHSKIRARANSAIVMQKVVKMYFARQLHAPRAKGLASLKMLTSQVSPLYETIEKLPKNKEKFQTAVDGVMAELKKCINTVKTTPGMTPAEIKTMEASLNTMIDKQLAALKKEQEKQKLAEEAERLRKIAAEMEAERKRKEEEEKRRLEDLAQMDIRKKMEAEQKKLDEEAAREEEKARIKAEKEGGDTKVQAQKKLIAKQEADETAMLEQERRDQELAMRLAQDHVSSSGEIGHVLSDDARAQASTGQAKRKKAAPNNDVAYNFGNKKQEALHKKHDLSKWKYADLRDTINTSCDVDLLEACREEFHRRLKVYHAWKMKNQNKQKAGNARAPASLQSAATNRGAAPPPPKPKKKENSRPQRFFRIPFIRPGDKNKAGSKKGWWFAHFDGQWIARQMELHPEKEAVLLVAGRDDMEMCELSLEETGLSRKRGAEILSREFEDEWGKNGGEPYEVNKKK
eukprot:m.172059 g.172059  ORF g.172059 m.172059 type:complete len:1230 (+) comp31666_c7_seq6:107-3796(+)